MGPKNTSKKIPDQPPRLTVNNLVARDKENPETARGNGATATATANTSSGGGSRVKGANVQAPENPHEETKTDQSRTGRIKNHLDLAKNDIMKEIVRSTSILKLQYEQLAQRLDQMDQRLSANLEQMNEMHGKKRNRTTKGGNKTNTDESSTKPFGECIAERDYTAANEAVGEFIKANYPSVQFEVQAFGARLGYITGKTAALSAAAASLMRQAGLEREARDNLLDSVNKQLLDEYRKLINPAVTHLLGSKGGGTALLDGGSDLARALKQKRADGHMPTRERPWTDVAVEASQHVKAGSKPSTEARLDPRMYRKTSDDAYGNAAFISLLEEINSHHNQTFWPADIDITYIKEAANALFGDDVIPIMTTSVALVEWVICFLECQHHGDVSKARTHYSKTVWNENGIKLYSKLMQEVNEYNSSSRRFLHHDEFYTVVERARSLQRNARHDALEQPADRVPHLDQDMMMIETLEQSE